ncbi:MAG: hypothetical protein COA84_07810 [Robiginitomaculum sp.]|nr:MAG: hypothetical protein COA84_07810 [Robiginitomaculum sp.]
MLTRTYFVYMMTNKKHGTLYTGVTNDLVKRVYQHREGQVEGFTRKHDLKRLVWYEPFDDIEQAIAQEKRIKRWRREWKFQLIEKQNPDGNDLWSEINK